MKAVSSCLCFMLLITVGKVRAATTPIMPRVMRTSANVNATFGSETGEVKREKTVSVELFFFPCNCFEL